MKDEEIDAMAARMKRLERVASASRRFMAHISGFRLAVDDQGTVRDLTLAGIPEVDDLKAALESLDTTAGE